MKIEIKEFGNGSEALFIDGSIWSMNVFFDRYETTDLKNYLDEHLIKICKFDFLENDLTFSHSIFVKMCKSARCNYLIDQRFGDITDFVSKLRIDGKIYYAIITSCIIDEGSRKSYFFDEKGDRFNASMIGQTIEELIV